MDEVMGWTCSEFIALLHTMVVDSLQWGVEKEEDRVRVMELLEWKDVTEQRSAEEAEQQFGAGLAAMGMDFDFEAQIAAQAAARMPAVAADVEQTVPVPEPEVSP